MNDNIERIAVGWRPVLLRSFASLGALWTVTEILDFFFDLSSAEQSWWLLPVFLVTAAFLGVLLGRQPKRAMIKIPGTDTEIRIIEGDLFEQSGVRAIAVNNFFDSAMPEQVDPKSLHGQLLTRFFTHRETEFRAAVESGLRDVESTFVERAAGATQRYPIGSVAHISTGSDRFLLFAMTSTDLSTFESSVTPADLHSALQGLWETARQKCGEEDLSLPLVGSGLGRVGLPTRPLLDIIIGSLILATRGKKVANRVSIVIDRNHIRDVDLRSVKEAWESQ